MEAPARTQLTALPEPVVVRKLWRGRRRDAAVYVSLAMRADLNVTDVRLWRLDGAGRMAPAEGFAVDPHRLPELAAALVAAHRRAIELALIEHRGGER